ncbi:hypothetical protein H4696_008036 [Amycolatopsis lexingtonensis]|uniref:DUF5709 domain-containing protein n=1 Tax=Amycolatopsis lexingtonensis TaxID=218822 RepID=A0ABR9ICN3_9PSEU|nr:hypothetical protein [Amycolatopsis lexingtonensis]MBE1500936.1 hypothetical protein [Amycolatopsis lexingtonensis]
MSEDPGDSNDIETEWEAQHLDQDHAHLSASADDEGHIDWDRATTQYHGDDKPETSSIFDLPDDKG